MVRGLFYWRLKMSMNIIDISKWQEGLNIKTLKQLNPDLDGVIIKATGGVTYNQSSFFSEWIKQCIELDLPFGLYHFYKDDGKASTPEAEAQFFVNAIRPYVGRAILALDWEQRALSLPTSYALRFLNEVYRLTGVKPLLYVQQNAVATKDWSAVVAKSYGLWMAEYGKNNPQNGFSEKTTYSSYSPWRVIAIHQYNSKTKLKGWNGYLDVNKAFMDKLAWGKYASPSGTSQPPSAASKNAATIVSQAQQWYGFNEADGSFQSIINLYNANTPSTYYKVKYTDAWCATFVSAVFIAAGMRDLIPIECSCPRMIEQMKKMGIWDENDARVPRVGDVIFYDWQDNANYSITDNIGTSDHVGIVTEVSGNIITVIEGNIHDSVDYRKVTVNGRYIRGYGVPRYGNSSTNPVNDKPTMKPSFNKIIKQLGIVKEHSLNVRLGPGAGYGTCSFSPLSKNVYIGICDEQNGWYYIKYGEKYGFVSSEYVALLENPTIFRQDLVGTYTTTAELNLRSGAGTNKYIIDVLDEGTVVQLLGQCTVVNGITWIIVMDGNRVGYVSSQYLKKGG